MLGVARAVGLLGTGFVDCIAGIRPPVVAVGLGFVGGLLAAEDEDSRKLPGACSV